MSRVKKFYSTRYYPVLDFIFYARAHSNKFLSTPLNTRRCTCPDCRCPDAAPPAVEGLV